MIKYTVVSEDQVALAGYEVYMKKVTPDLVIADYTGRYPTLWTDKWYVTFMQENALVNDENYVPDSKYKIGKHPKTIRLLIKR